MVGTVPLLGLDFADLDVQAASQWIADRDPKAAFGYVVTPNSDHLARLATRPELLPLYQGAILRLLDSRVIAGLARALGMRPPAVAPGSDLTGVLLKRHVFPGERVTIIGLREDWLPGLVAHCGLTTAPAHHYPPFGFERDPVAMGRAVQFALDHPARLLFLAVGSPRQEMLAAAIAATGRATGTGLCVGASLDFLSGHVKRAPLWMQRASIEWLHRLLTSPRLARRYLWDCPAVLPMLLRERRAR